MKKWLGRFAFSFIVIAAVLAWEGRKRGGPLSYYIPAGILFGLGLAGMRERHRPEQSNKINRPQMNTDEHR